MTVLAAALAGCTGEASFQPAARGAAGTQPLALPAAGPLASGLAPWSRIPAKQFSLGASPGLRRTFYLFLNGNITGNLDAYEVSTGKLVGECDRCGGWGLTTQKKTGDIAFGADGGSVVVCHVTKVVTPYATLTLSGAGSNALGIAFDVKGDVFAGNYPTGVVDEFDAATIAAGGGGPDHSYVLRDFAAVYYLASNGYAVFVDGLDAKSNFIVGTLSTTNKRGDSILQTFGSSTKGLDFPGGLAVDIHNVLSVDDQYRGTISTFAKPWTGGATSTLTWGYPTNDYSGIALDHSQTTLWAANSYSNAGATYSDGVANSYPLGSIGNATSGPVEDKYVSVTLSPLQ